MKNQDELIGTWTGGADDGSGLRTMIYNFGLTLNKNGSGVSFSWEKAKERYDEDNAKIEWEYLGESKIKIRYLEEDVEEWEILEYEISDFIGAYNSKHFKLVEKGKSTFWEFPEPIYKNKENGREDGFFSRLWKRIFENKKK